MIEQVPHTFIKGTVQSWMFYKSIKELPVLRWFEILKTGKLNYLFLSGNGRVNNYVINLWEEIQQEYFDEFGVDDSFLIRLQKTKKLIELNCDLIITENRFLLNQINQIELELNQVGEGQVVSHFKVKEQIEKHRKHPIDLKVLTVIEWGHMVKDFIDTMNRAKSENLKQKNRGRGGN